MAERGEGELDARARLMEEVWSDPVHGPGLKKIIKAKYGDKANIPEVDLRAEVDQAKAELRKERDDLRRERDLEKGRTETEAARATLRTQGFSAEDIKAIEAMMIERGIGTHEDAAALYKAARQVAAPRSGPYGVTMPAESVDAFFKGLSEDPTKWARERAYRDIDALQHQRRLDPSPIMTEVG